MPRFHIEPDSVRDGVAVLSTAESHHALSVLRLRSGSVVELIDGKGGSFRGVIVNAENGRVRVAVDNARNPVRALSTELDLAMAVIKPERMEWVIQKACELGAHAIHPILSERSVVKLSETRWQAKIARWRKIALESCKQCGRSDLPRVSDIGSLKDLFRVQETAYETILLPTLAIKTRPLLEVLKEKPARRVLILIGPEGDFSKKEAEFLLERGARAVSLGELVMRSETAALYVLSCLNFYYREV